MDSETENVIFHLFYKHFRDSRLVLGGIYDWLGWKLKRKMLIFHWFYKHFLPLDCPAKRRDNGGPTEEQRRNNGGITRAAAPCRGFSIGFPCIFTILIFEPLLEPLQHTAVREFFFMGLFED